jgi:serine/threonine-protein phosphatase 6 regulatory subunit 3
MIVYINQLSEGYISIQLQVESVLDKDVYSLEELLDEDDIIQECKSLNGRLINL